MKFVIGSSSQRKITSAEKIIKSLFVGHKIEIQGYAAKSHVPDTPYDKQTFEGAKNRAVDAKANISTGDFYIGLESGLIERYGHIFEEAWAAVIQAEDREFFGYSSGLKVPDYILKRMDDMKMEHSDVMSAIESEFGKMPNDTWGTYSGGLILRDVSLEEALRNALIQAVASDASFYKK